jgi:hypothetical protein
VDHELSNADNHTLRGLNENAPVPAGYEAGLGARSREERYCAAEHDRRRARSQRRLMWVIHK